MTDDLARLQVLMDLEAIRTLKARYCRTIDVKAWNEWREVFCEDVTFEGLSAPFTDLDEFMRVQQDRLSDAISVHHCHTAELEITGIDSATGIWAMCDYVEYPWQEERRGFVGYGFYHERYRRTADGWRIASLRMERLRFDPLQGPHLPPFQWFTALNDGSTIPAGRVLDPS
jgi:3-phenylpropionate/cinnamic acid dioxygenase small subunit